jgi:activating signal cointegrator complex subunit 3
MTDTLNRIFRALFEIAISRHWITLGTKLLNLCKMVEKRLWGFYHPLRQFSHLPLGVIQKLEDKKV